MNAIKNAQNLQKDLSQYQEQQKAIKLIKLTTENAKLRDEGGRLRETNNYLEQSLHDLQQYSKRNNLELSGLEECKDGNEEETKLIEFFQELGVTIDIDDIEACHRPNERIGRNHYL